MSIRRGPIELFFSSAVSASLRAMSGRYAIANKSRGNSVSTRVGKRTRISAAECKRQARKLRNVRRHKQAMKRRGRA